MKALFLATALCAAAQIPLPLDQAAVEALAARVRAGSMPDIRDQLEDAATRASAAGDPVSAAWARAGLGALHEHNRRYLLAENVIRDAARQAADKDPLFHACAALWLARESDRAGRFLRLRYWAELAAAGFRAAHDRRRLAQSLHLLAGAARGRERTELLAQALAAARVGGDRRDSAVIQAGWGEALRANGDFAAAIRVIGEAARNLENAGAWSEAGRALTLLARAHNAHGHRREALFQASRAEALLTKAGAEPEALRTRVEMGNLLATLGERAAALRNLDRVRLAVTGQDWVLSSSQSAAIWIHSYLALGEYERVVAMVASLEQAGSRRPPAAALWMKSAALFHLGRYSDSIDAATGAIRVAGQPEALTNVSAYRWRARALDRLGRHEEAAADALEMARLGEAVLGKTAPDDEWKRAFVESKEDFADDIVAVLWRATKPTEALEVAERFRARAFLDLIASRDGEAVPALNPSASAEPRLSSSPAASAVSPGRIAAYAAAGGGFVVSYWVHPECLYIWLFTTAGEIKPVRVPVTEARLAALVERARRMNYQADRAAWRELHRILIAPLSPWLSRSGGTSLTVLAHGPLHRLPFSGLLAPSGRYLVEDFRLRAAPAAGFLLRGSHASSGPLVLIGGPRNPPPGLDGRPLPALPGARAELQRVGAAARGASVFLSGAAMREDRVREEATRGVVLHFATHAVVDEQRPFESFLALSDREKLTAGQVYRLRLQADLVTLSACRGGSGRISSDGILGFPRAFLYAGASSVVAPLWDIPDATTGRLMEQFYRHYRAGRSKSEALRLAQLSLLRDLRASRVTVATPAGPMTLPEHPALWAGFSLLGAD